VCRPARTASAPEVGLTLAEANRSWPTATICGTDRHILKGDVPTCQPGGILSHEGVGTVEGIGTGIAVARGWTPVVREKLKAILRIESACRRLTARWPRCRACPHWRGRLPVTAACGPKNSKWMCPAATPV
jgi:hypothetical protein